MGWVPQEYLESAVRDVLTAADTHVDDVVGYAALLLASAGAVKESDGLVSTWHSLTERPVGLLAADGVRARAFAMLFDARGAVPSWAAPLIPLDLDAEERAHARYLRTRDSVVPPGLLGDSATAKIVSALAENLDGMSRTDRIRLAAADVEVLGAPALPAWAELARNSFRPDVASLTACRSVAPLLVAGADPLDLGEEWLRRCVGDLLAALRTRYPVTAKLSGMSQLVDAIIQRRGCSKPAPASATALAEAEQRLGAALPDDYREFLLTCDGLLADDVFPRLLSCGELSPAEKGVVVISERTAHGVILLTPVGLGWRTVEWDPDLGTTTHRTFRHLLDEHLRLLVQL
ncbi:MAG: hypothetical protein JWQ81_8354 [Amycolatopsis sp.]|uniref:SMI1/KNR4 family protein n=1 Tax=Amycolatopsis sp. TaxID=37632 RepID=UPI002608616C|nr:SMI1/KNR4 family protein [Amycolatopsis sp.]MCU1687615.1 hypothetical protein [Amycolatopsis sp.]